MTIIRPSKPANQSQAVGSSELEGQTREVNRSDVVPARKPQAEGGDTEIGAGSANALLQQVAGTTFEEINRLIDELHGLRDLLQGEGQRVQREIVKYAQLSQAAMKSAKVIAEGMTQLQSSAETTQARPGQNANGANLPPAQELPRWRGRAG
jgi:hypothetical protein